MIKEGLKLLASVGTIALGAEKIYKLGKGAFEDFSKKNVFEEAKAVAEVKIAEERARAAIESRANRRCEQAKKEAAESIAAAKKEVVAETIAAVKTPITKEEKKQIGAFSAGDKVMVITAPFDGLIATVNEIYKGFIICNFNADDIKASLQDDVLKLGGGNVKTAAFKAYDLIKVDTDFNWNAEGRFQLANFNKTIGVLFDVNKVVGSVDTYCTEKILNKMRCKASELDKKLQAESLGESKD